MLQKELTVILNYMATILITHSCLFLAPNDQAIELMPSESPCDSTSLPPSVNLPSHIPPLTSVSTLINDGPPATLESSMTLDDFSPRPST